MKDANQHFHTAMNAFNAGDMDRAERNFKKALKAAPSHVGALNLLAVVLVRGHRHAEAEGFIARAVKLDQSSDASFYNYGTVLKQLGKPAQALEQFERALRLNAKSIDAWNNHGTSLNDLGRHDEAVSSFDEALTLNPKHAPALANKAKTLTELRRFDEALAIFDNALAIDPQFLFALLGRGYVLTQLGRLTEAEATFDRAVALAPEIAEAWLERGKYLIDAGKDAEALASVGKAVALRPDFADAQWNLAFLKLLTGDYAQGWPLYEWRWKTSWSAPARRNFKAPLWLGDKDIAGKTLLVHAEQGLGDTIQFVRYVPLLKDKGCKVIFEAQPALLPLLRAQGFDAEIIARGDPLPAFDVHCPLLSLPTAFKTTLDSVPAPIPYLKADATRIASFHERLGEKRKVRVGLVWSGNAAFLKDHQRRIRFEQLAALLDDTHEWFAVQKDIRDEDREALAAHPAVKDMSGALSDFADTAALLAELDLVISIDTGVAHLAGAMGKPVWMLLAFNADFRWLRERSGSPWYPTATLFRQPAPNDWQSVINAVKQRLAHAQP